MKDLIHKDRGIPFITFYTLFAIGINYCGSVLAETIVFPLYLDSVLSISVVALCGYIPGLICALGSNFLLSLFTKSTYLFSICHIMTVTFAWQVFNLHNKNSDKPYTLDCFLWAGFWAAVSNGRFSFCRKHRSPFCKHCCTGNLRRNSKPNICQQLWWFIGKYGR